MRPIAFLSSLIVALRRVLFCFVAVKSPKRMCECVISTNILEFTFDCIVLKYVVK